MTVTVKQNAAEKVFFENFLKKMKHTNDAEHTYCFDDKNFVEVHKQEIEALREYCLIKNCKNRPPFYHLIFTWTKPGRELAKRYGVEV